MTKKDWNEQNRDYIFNKKVKTEISIVSKIKG